MLFEFNFFSAGDLQPVTVLLSGVCVSAPTTSLHVTVGGNDPPKRRTEF